MSDINRFYRRNETALLWQGIIFFLGVCFIDSNAVVPVFISTMGGSLALAGLVSAVRIVPSIFCQLILGVQTGRIKNLTRYITAIMAVAYALPAVVAVVLLLNPSPAVSLGTFLMLYALLWAGDGSLLIGWYGVFGRAVDPRRRGLIMGRQQLFGGVLALLGTYVVRLVLGAEGIPVTTRYAVLFGLAGLIMAGSAIPMAFVKDTPHAEVRQESVLKHIASFPALFQANRLFRRMTAVQVLQGVAAMALPLLALFSGKTFQFTLAQTAWLVTAQTAGSLAGGLIWGAVSHRLGNARVIQLDQCNILLIMILALTAMLTGQSWLAYPLSALAGVTFSCWIGFPNFIIDHTDEASRPRYLVMSGLLSLPATFMPWVAGLFAEAFGFIPVFVFCACVAGASLYLSRRLAENFVIDSYKNG